MEFRILGPLEVVGEGGPSRIPGAKERSLLALLLLHPGQVVSADRLIDELWGAQPPANAANALQVRVSQLRRALGPGVIVTRSRGYQLDVDPEQIDAQRFERLLREKRFDEALKLWRGGALAEFAYEGFAQPEIARLEELRVGAIEERIEAQLVAGEDAELVSDLEALVAKHPLRERLRGQLMLALYRSGRQAEALNAYQETRKVLATELGIDPSPQLQRLEQTILKQDPSLAAVRQTPRTNLPVRFTSFVGRSAELEEVAGLLRRHRLVTLEGPGGVGKTALAVEVARRLVDCNTHGAWLAELANLTDPALLSTAISGALGISADELVDYLRAKQLLLVLDNCEHLVQGCAELAERLLSSAPELRILATSREPLALPGEARWQVPPLGLPEGPMQWEMFDDSDAVGLFVDRAGAARPGFILDAETGPVVVEICRSLDGLPLAIELAAARVAALPVTEIGTRLSDRFGLLTTPRRTLRATLDWSYELLSEPERVLFARLAVFSGGWTVEAAEGVCPDGGIGTGQVLDALLRLVDRSLVAAAGGDPPRFHLLETMRAYAHDRLVETGESARVERRHATWFRDLAERADGRLPESEHDNLRAAMDWALSSGDQETALRLGAALVWFWFGRHFEEGEQRLNAIIATSDTTPSLNLARALLAQATIGADVERGGATLESARRSFQMFTEFDDRAGAARSRLALAGAEIQSGGDVKHAEEQLDQAEAVLQELGTDHDIALAASMRMQLGIFLGGSLDRAIASGRHALERFRTVGYEPGVAFALWHVAWATRAQGDLKAAARLNEEALAYARETRNLWMVVTALSELGLLAALRGEHAQAAAWHDEALAVARHHGARRGIVFVYNAMGLAARARGDVDRARELHLKALPIHEDLRHPRIVFTLCWLGLAEARLGRWDEAEAHLRQALTRAEELKQTRAIAPALEGLAAAAVARNDPQRAVALLDEASSLRERLGTPPDPLERSDRERTAAAATRMTDRAQSPESEIR